MTVLSYLFSCRFKDGSAVQQTIEDVSISDPTRSAFYDVVQRIAEVETFTITKREGRQDTFMVDLRDGHFEINGVPFGASSDDLPQCEYRLIYFHRHVHSVIQGQALSGDSAAIAYYIGWQTTVDGKNFQQLISAK